ncbi:MAG: OadG family protein [Planctomycetes bacterium]|nr:OadG family protein [Planctomycetota bacterium]
MTEGVLHNLLEGLLLSGVGMVIVFAVLALLTGIIAAVRRLDGRWQERERDAEAGALQRDAGIDSITLILIAAAAATVIGGRHHVRRIRRVRAVHDGGSWSEQGRIVLQGSHAIARRPARPERARGRWFGGRRGERR